MKTANAIQYWSAHDGDGHIPRQSVDWYATKRKKKQERKVAEKTHAEVTAAFIGSRFAELHFWRNGTAIERQYDERNYAQRGMRLIFSHGGIQGQLTSAKRGCRHSAACVRCLGLNK